MPFENAAAEGTFNAMLAARWVPYDQLREYTFDRERHAPLPVWIAMIGSRSVVPIAVTPALDCDRTIVGAGSSSRPEAERALCDAALSGGRDAATSVTPQERREARENAWTAFYGSHAASLELDSDATPPRVWHFVYAALIVGFLADKALQRRRRLRFSTAAPPPTLDPGDDERTVDGALLRTKWALYGFLRTYVLTFCLAYMSCVYLCVFRTYSFRWQGAVLGIWCPGVIAAVGVLFVAIGDTATAFWRFLRDYTVLLHRFRSWSLLGYLVRRMGMVDAGTALAPPRPPTKPTFWHRLSSVAGFGEPSNRWEAVSTSCAQMRSLLTLSLWTIAAFVYWIGDESLTVFRGAPAGGLRAAPIMTLSVLRHLLLVDGVSPAGPLLLCAVCVYVWACGRMSRLYVMHGLARMTPPGAMVELVSTPLYAVCTPPGRAAPVEARPTEDRGLAVVERAVVNAIARPSTGPVHLVTLAVIIAFPLVLFALKPPSTVENGSGTIVLCAALALSAILIGATLTQLVQYWLALRHLLRRILEHPVGRGLRNVAPYARDSLVNVLSRPPDDLLRFTACARDFIGLVTESNALGTTSELRGAIEAVCWAAPAVEVMRATALAAAPRDGSAAAHDREAVLGSAVVGSATLVSELLRDVSQGLVSGSGADPAVPSKDASPSRDGSPPEERDALSSVAWKFSGAELAWLRRAQAYVATVAALLVVRYARHFRVFAYTLTTCALILLLAVVSYPFEPHRLLLTGIWVVMLSVVVAGLWVYVELDQNGVMSRISGTEPGKVTLNGALAAHVMTWVVLPLVGVAAAQYPQVAKTLFQVVEPFAKALK
ncbi:MAG TPA: hypothetical protein VKU41_25060 [Polyangiaceae bacterium]|nr:hypothetical protein [Polyangiaceae bacterium]